MRFTAPEVSCHSEAKATRHAEASGLKRKWGQAMVELMVGLVALIALFACLRIGISLLSAHTATMVEARANAGRQSMTDPGQADILWTDTPAYILNWEAGDDGKRYTRDDTMTSDSAIPFSDEIVNRTVADPADWSIVDAVPGNEISALHDSINPILYFGLVRGESQTVTVDLNLMPAFRHLLYEEDSIDIQNEVWLTWTRGIY